MESNVLNQRYNATYHTSNKVREFLSENNIDVMFWPANSPDLDPRENILAILKKSIGVGQCW